MRKIIYLCMATILLLSSCATIFTGTKDTIKFNTTPQGAKVYVDGLVICKTPCTLKMKRSITDKMVDIKLDGYETRIITLDREFNAVSVLNLSNIIGWGIDAATGSLMKYGRKVYDIELEKDEATSFFKQADIIEVDTKKKTVEVYITQK